MMRVSVSMAASGRFQEQVAAYYDVLFTQVHARLCTYAKATFGMSARVSAEAAHRLMGQVLYPRLQRALFGLEPLAPDFGQEGIAPEFDLKPVRKAVTEWMESLES